VILFGQGREEPYSWVMNSARTLIKDPELPEPGRKTIYSAALRDTVCDLLAEGASWRTIEDRGIISQKTLANWLKTIPEFRHEYMLAKVARVEGMMAEMDRLLVALAANPTQVEVNAIKVCIDTIKWKVSRCYPRMYGVGLIHDADWSAPAPESDYDFSLLTDGEVRTLRIILTKCLVNKEAVV